MQLRTTTCGNGLAWKDLKEMRKKLYAAHKSKYLAAVHTLRSRLLTLKLEREDTIRAFVTQICKIEYELVGAGKTIDDCDKKFTLLNGLKEDCIVKKTILDENVSLFVEEIVCSLEMTEEDLSQGGKKANGYSSGSEFMSRGYGMKKKRKFYICYKTAHKM